MFHQRVGGNNRGNLNDRQNSREPDSVPLCWRRIDMLTCFQDPDEWDIWEVAWHSDLLYRLNLYTHWSERDWHSSNLKSQVSFESRRLKGRACQGEIWPKGGGCSPSWAGQRGNKGEGEEGGGGRWQGGASHATFWPQAFTCRLLMALFCVNMPSLFGRDVGVCPTVESIWGAHILPHTVMNPDYECLHCLFKRGFFLRSAEQYCVTSRTTPTHFRTQQSLINHDALMLGSTCAVHTLTIEVMLVGD